MEGPVLNPAYPPIKGMRGFSNYNINVSVRKSCIS
jgi:hypothetical protein